MKRVIGILAVAITTLAGLAGTAQAGHRPSVYVSGYTAYGTPIYTERVLVGYDVYRRPVYQYRQLPVREYCPPAPRPSYRVEYYERCEPVYVPPPCPPRYADPCPPRYSYPRSRTEVVVSGRGGYFSWRQ